MRKSPGTTRRGSAPNPSGGRKAPSIAGQSAKLAKSSAGRVKSGSEAKTPRRGGARGR